MNPIYATPDWCFYLEENRPNGYIGHKCEKDKPFIVYETFCISNNKLLLFSSHCLNCKREIDPSVLFQIKLLV